jgi:hypothetical protein
VLGLPKFVKVEETIRGFDVMLVTFQVLLYHFFSFVNIYKSMTFLIVDTKGVVF